MKINSWMKLIAAIVFCQMAGLIGSLFTFTAIPTWYAQLNKPFFNPPNWVFGPVWTMLFTLMGISLYIIWTKKQNKKTRQAINIFLVQLVLNTLWSILFFGLKSPTLAFIEILILWFAIYTTIAHFWRLSKPSAYLLVPYIAWVSFASLLNLAIVILN